VQRRTRISSGADAQYHFSNRWRSSERAILVRCIMRITSSGTRCSSCNLVVLVTLGGCHLLDGLVACDSVKARKKIVRGSGEALCFLLTSCVGVPPVSKVLVHMFV
jgi:hypothetical protein